MIKFPHKFKMNGHPFVVSIESNRWFFKSLQSDIVATVNPRRHLWSLQCAARYFFVEHVVPALDHVTKFDSSKFKVAEEISFFDGSTTHIGMTVDGEEITDYYSSKDEAEYALISEVVVIDGIPPDFTYNFSKYSVSGDAVSSLSTLGIFGKQCTG